jgi:hypothetical protein
MEPISFWAFTKLCLAKAAHSTVDFMDWNMKSIAIGAVVLAIGFLLFWWQRGRADAQHRAWEDFLWIFAPMVIVFACLLIFNIFRSPLLVYREKQEQLQTSDEHVKKLEREKAAAVSELAQERDKRRPKFEITYGNSIVSSVTLHLPDGRMEEHSSVFLPVTVYNQGAPSIIKRPQLALKLKDGSLVEGERFMPAQKEIVFSGVNVRYSRDQALALRASTPIPTGGQCDGYLMFIFPPELRKELGGKITFILTIYDIEGNPYVVEIDNDGKPVKDIITPADMTQKER